MARQASEGLPTSLDEDQTVRLEDYINDQLQTYADLEGLDALLENVKTQQELLRKQLQDAEQLSRNAKNGFTRNHEELSKSTRDFQRKQHDIDRRLLILTRSDTPEDAVQKLMPIMERLQQLAVARDYVDLLAEVHSLSSQARDCLTTAPRESLRLYLRMKQISKSLKKAQPLAEDAAPHLVDHVEEEVVNLWTQMKEKYVTKFEQTLKKMKWPGKDISLDGALAQEWSDGVARLLELQESDLLDQEAKDIKDSSSPMLVLLPLQAMVQPLEIRFKYHFSGDKPTNKLDKPELFLSHVIGLLSTYEQFLAIYLQPVLTERFKDSVLALNPHYTDALSAFITALLPMLRQKLFNIMPQISTQPQLFSHLIHELLSFDRGLRDEWGYSGGTAADAWKGLTWEVLDRTSWDWFPRWLQIERDFALARYDKIIAQSDGGEIDTDSVDTGITKPTKTAFRVNDLLETITDRYRDLPSFYQKVQFLISVQIAIFDKFHERLHSSLEAYLTMTSSVGRTVQGVSKEEQAQLQGSQGLDRLCRIYGSAEYLERKMQDWSEDVLFLELWDEIQYFNSTKAENGNSIGGTLTFEQVAERTSKGLGNEDERGALFDETRAAYKRLRVKTEGVMLDMLTHSIREAIKPFGRINTWAVASSGSTLDDSAPNRSAELDAAIKTLHEYFSFLSGVLSVLALRRVARQLASIVQIWVWDNVIMRHQFSAIGSRQLQRDTGELELAIGRHAGAKPGRPCMRRLSEAVELLNLPPRQEASEEIDKDEDNAWDMDDDEDEENGISPKANIHDVERKVFHDNESAREVLEDLGMEALSENDARNVLGKRIGLES